MRRDYIFNQRKPRLLRTHIPRTENIAVVVILFAMFSLLAWIASTRYDFDPNERDLPNDPQNSAAATDIEIYTRPLQPWVEPGHPTPSVAFDLGPFPAATVDQDWHPTGRIKRFQADNLYQKINGEAEKFIKQGFVELAYLVLRSDSEGSEIAIELFDQGGLGGSLGVFTSHATGRDVKDRQGVHFFNTGAGMIGRQGRFFFRVAGDRQSQAITDKASQLINVFAMLGDRQPSATTTEHLPAGFALLRDRLGIAEADIQFEESNVFQYDFASRFWFGETGLVGGGRVFVHVAEDPEAAKRLLDLLLEAHGDEYDRVTIDGPYTLFKHRFLNTYFAVTRRGQHVYGVEQLPDAASVDTLIGKLSENIAPIPDQARP